MKTVRVVVAAVVIMAAFMTGCNNGLSSNGESDSRNTSKRDRKQRTTIDSAEYIDFTVEKYNAKKIQREDLLYTLNGVTYKNGNSTIKVKTHEGVIEISSDNGYFNGKQNCQVYGVYAFDIQAASEDCLYIRKNQRKPGYLLIDNIIYRDDAVPDLAVCLPLYGYSRNRIEVSSIMDGYIAMPSGTYWKQ